MECRCGTMNESFGSEAETYAAEHLVRGEVSSGTMEERYTCPDTAGSSSSIGRNGRRASRDRRG
jgi:hypothetical protein